jgi:hypothetical protein
MNDERKPPSDNEDIQSPPRETKPGWPPPVEVATATATAFAAVVAMAANQPKAALLFSVLTFGLLLARIVRGWLSYREAARASDRQLKAAPRAATGSS